jgi:hypothetical protein
VEILTATAGAFVEANFGLDLDLRAKIIEGQRRRLADFGDARITRELTALVHQLS